MRQLTAHLHAVVYPKLLKCSGNLSRMIGCQFGATRTRLNWSDFLEWNQDMHILIYYIHPGPSMPNAKGWKEGGDQ